MKYKLKWLFSALTVSALTAPALLSAQVTTPPGTGLPEGTITGIVTQLMNWGLMLIGILGVIGFVISGILYLTAAGNEGQIDKAKSAMIWSIVGIIVALLGVIILRAAQALLSGKSADF